MTLLIVDDEELTRDGLIHSINWENLGIDTIYEADDGFHGLELAKQHAPEIILSDVRMPRMDGIEMAYKIRDLMPDCSIIFMSGYSDKSYLKAAIRLKAISYVEKPIDPIEIADSVKEAISNHKLLLFNKQSASSNKQDTISKLALKLIYPNYDSSASYHDTFSLLDFSLKNILSFATLIIRVVNHKSNISEVALNAIASNLNNNIKLNNIELIYGIKQEEYIICHLFSYDKLELPTLIKLTQRFSDSLKDNYLHFISLGKIVNSVQKVYESYNSAIILMHSSFFYQYNTLLFNESEHVTSTILIPTDLVSNFSDSLLQRNKNSVQTLLVNLKSILFNNKSILVNHVKDVYYKLFLELNATANSFHVSISADSSESILDYVSNSLTLFELHAMLEDKIDCFFKSFDDENRDNSTVFLIKEYIGQNYQNENLSIQDISKHVFLSSSYVCTVFKIETGKTLNQFLTEYRIEKAKKLLMDSRYKITDISTKVGYNDGNYFGKSFKKSVGLSPSEFREQFLEGKS